MINLPVGLIRNFVFLMIFATTMFSFQYRALSDDVANDNMELSKSEIGRLNIELSRKDNLIAELRKELINKEKSLTGLSMTVKTLKKDVVKQKEKIISIIGKKVNNATSIKNRIIAKIKEEILHGSS